MPKANLKPKILLKPRKLQFHKICRTCLSERGHLRELFATRLPEMMESFAQIEVSEDDELPSKVCVSCFQQIAKFYTFKKKLERNDRILRKYLKKEKLGKFDQFADILGKAVNNAEIIERVEKKTDEDDGDVGISLNEHIKDDKECTRSSQRLLRKSKLQANKLIDTIVNETEGDESDSSCDDFRPLSELGVKEYNNYTSSATTNNSDHFIFSDEPPPLIPLASSKVNNEIDSATLNVKDLPNTPPLVPIKPFSSLNPATIVNASSDNIEDPVKLKLQCNTCNEEFYSVSALKNHRLRQCQSKGMQCTICKKEFNDRNRLIGHLKGHIIPKDYVCQICAKCYPNPSTFRVHMRTHTGERPFKCHVCNKGFIRWAGVVGHMKTHTSNKPFICQTCGKGFKISSNLERHKVLHSGIMPFCCSYCGKTFSQSDNLQLHVRTYHTNDRPYLCNECGKRFVSSTRLKRHMWVHTGFKPYRCRHCSKAYSNSNDRKHHEKTHIGTTSQTDKPHACRKCEMRFSHPCRLTKHMKTHERPFPCTECTKTFSSVVLLNKHILNIHGPEYIEHLSMPLTIEEVYINYD